jgi:hypothetical protein
LVVHKGIAQLDDSTLSKVAGVVTFGDPWHWFSDTPLPATIPTANLDSLCLTGTIFDPLCANLPNDFKVPTSISDILGPFADLPSMAIGAQQVKAAAMLLAAFPLQVAQNLSTVVEDLASGQFGRLLLTPQHFLYGNTNQTGLAADFIVSLPGVQSALSAS